MSRSTVKVKVTQSYSWYKARSTRVWHLDPEIIEEKESYTQLGLHLDKWLDCGPCCKGTVTKLHVYVKPSLPQRIYMGHLKNNEAKQSNSLKKVNNLHKLNTYICDSMTLICVESFMTINAVSQM